MQRGAAAVRNAQTIVWGIISFLIGLIFGTLMIVAYESVSFKPWQWKYPPIVLNCYGDDMNESYISSAVHYWTIRDHNFAYIENNPPRHMCKADHIQGFIIIKQKRLPTNTLGVTQRKIFLGNIVAATIYFDSGSYRITNVFEHEIGHALGYNHLEEEGHIMHPLWEKMSPKFWIPE